MYIEAAEQKVGCPGWFSSKGFITNSGLRFPCYLLTWMIALMDKYRVRKWSRSNGGWLRAFHGTVCNGLCRQRFESVVRVLWSLFRQCSTMMLPLIIFGLLFFQRADKTWLLLHPSHSVPTQILLVSKPITWDDRKPIWDSKPTLYRGICTHFLWSVLKHWDGTWGI